MDTAEGQATQKKKSRTTLKKVTKKVKKLQKIQKVT